MANPDGTPAIDAVANNRRSVTPIPPPIESVPKLSTVLRAGLVTGITSSLVCWLFFGIGSLFGTEFDIDVLGASGLVHVPWYLVVLVPLAVVMGYAAIAAGLRERPGCRRICLLIGYAVGLLAAVSFLIQPPEVTWPTRIWLVLCVAATTVIAVPQIARVVGDSDPQVTAGHRRLGLDAA